MDMLTELTGVGVRSYAEDERWRELRSWLVKPAIHGVFLNTELPPFDNLHMRRAVAYALDPSVLSRMNIDPAIAGGVVLTTITDVTGFFAFLGLATWAYA